MTMFGISSAVKPDNGSLKLQVHTGWLRGLLVLGFGAGIPVGLALALFDLIQHDPKEGFALLKVWGPWAVVVAFAMYLIWRIASELIGIVKVAADAFLRSNERQAVAIETVAAAQSKLADKDDRAAQEMQTLTAVTAQRSERTHAMLQAYHETNTSTMSRIETKLDEAMKEWRST